MLRAVLFYVRGKLLRLLASLSPAGEGQDTVLRRADRSALVERPWRGCTKSFSASTVVVTFLEKGATPAGGNAARGA